VREDSRAHDEHALGGRARPAHAGSAQAVPEALDPALDRARAQRPVVLVKLLILHAAGVLAEILGLGAEPGALQSLDDVGRVNQEKIIAPGLLPGLGGGRILGVKGFGTTRQILGRVIPVHTSSLRAGFCYLRPTGGRKMKAPMTAAMSAGSMSVHPPNADLMPSALGANLNPQPRQRRSDRHSDRPNCPTSRASHRSPEP
jgi:hypothetical protein